MHSKLCGRDVKIRHVSKLQRQLAVLPAIARFLVFKLAYSTSSAAMLHDWSAADVESAVYVSESTMKQMWCSVQFKSTQTIATRGTHLLSW